MSDFFQTATPITIILYILFQTIMKYFEIKDKTLQRDFENKQTEQKTTNEIEVQTKLDIIAKKQSDLASQLHSKIDNLSSCFSHTEDVVDNRMDLLQQSILNDRLMSNTEFAELTHYIINFYVEKTKNDVNNEFDKNGLSTQSDIDRLVKNLDYWAKINRNTARDIISSFDDRYDKVKLNTYLEVAAEAFKKYNDGVQKVLDSIKLEDVEVVRSKHFVSWKNDMRNEIDNFRDNLKAIIVDITQ